MVCCLAIKNACLAAAGNNIFGFGAALVPL
jgi:hypothetical protein